MTYLLAGSVALAMYAAVMIGGGMMFLMMVRVEDPLVKRAMFGS